MSMLFKRNKNSEAILGYFKEKSKKKKLKKEAISNQKEAIQEATRMLTKSEMRKEKRRKKWHYKRTLHLRRRFACSGRAGKRRHKARRNNTRPAQKGL